MIQIKWLGCNINVIHLKKYIHYYHNLTQNKHHRSQREIKMYIYFCLTILANYNNSTCNFLPHYYK